MLFCKGFPMGASKQFKNPSILLNRKVHNAVLETEKNKYRCQAPSL